MARSFQHEFRSSVDNGRGSWRHNLLLGIVLRDRTLMPKRRVLPLRRLHLADTGLVVTQLGVGFDLVEARVFEGPL